MGAPARSRIPTGGTALPPAEGLVRAQALLDGGQPLEALNLLEAVHSAQPQHPRVASRLGLLLGEQRGLTRRALQLCTASLETDGSDVELHANLVKLHMCMRQRAEAVKVLVAALERFPSDAALCALRDRVGLRRKPFVPALPRSHPLNRWVGMFTWRFRAFWHALGHGLPRPR